jgi:hypothetical protein
LPGSRNSYYHYFSILTKCELKLILTVATAVSQESQRVRATAVRPLGEAVVGGGIENHGATVDIDLKRGESSEEADV